jgi:hypothetical protein
MFYNKEKEASIMKNNRSSGNVLFLILIAVALFAALTAAITQSDRGSTDMSKERGNISATDYMTFANSVEKTVARMLGDEISENGLSFENTAWKKYDGSDVETAAMFANCTSAKCKVFDSAGGGLDARTFNPVAVASPANGDIQSGHAGVYSMKVTGVGTSAWDLVLMIAVIDQNTCIQINKALGITTASGLPPSDTWAGAVLYSGSFTGPNDATDEIGDIATEIDGKSAGCITRQGGAYGKDDNYLYQVLLPR